ncbi:hypothetical protein BSS2_I1530 [Brucella suis bv. 1 str. S2]|uniref:Uncharacterized protein n=2 Tax=Brucella TaxID=234 RepID=A0A0H3G401_BRUSU|nr:hypothetical protein BR1578 [Brucella suis 1330]ACU48555.1 hypothetical protein BMI_I1591 [Brucella microti CCM 4915]AEK54881.1 hypothetical protein BPI_I1631 [Brucella pinnipedialis B2/94]AEU06568.1 hypothetical protein BSVBI22_A1572 [Brucella suis VBI22]AHN47185.1 hypothetical protein BSS2_I1530 [Brucella suis bv. 1 str. S2]EFM56785.1 Hypothetical protein BIBO1_1252 [Brucella inopinata BO1]EFM58304.1 Hypothetical protein BIBO2_2837 [Brucella sp. BO2]CDL76962.1 unnamed protein product [B
MTDGSEKQWETAVSGRVNRFYAGNCNERRNQEHFRRYGT